MSLRDLPIEADERRLVARLLAGDQQAFETCFAEYFPRLFRFALRRVGNVDAAEDIAQATLCRALESLPTFRGEASLFTWLCTLCRREMFRRSGGRTAESSAAVVLSEDDPDVRAALESLAALDADDPASLASVQQLREAVLVALDYISPAYARVLELKYIHELPVTAIAERLGRSPKATESLLTRAREAFRESFSLLAEERRT